MRRISQHEFYAHLRRAESARNAAHRAQHRPRLGDTLWTVAGQLVAVSTSRAYFID